VTLQNGQVVPLKMSVKSISFSAHSDRQQTEEFIEETKPQHIILVHGDSTNMSRLKQVLENKFENTQIYSPKNCKTVEIMFRGERMGKIVGTLGLKILTENIKNIDGILLKRDFQHLIVSSKDLQTYSDIKSIAISQKVVIPIPKNTIWRENINKIFQDVTVIEINEELYKIKVFFITNFIKDWKLSIM
jgi:cleavage and polyadenylation specificity factor subunit 3